MDDTVIGLLVFLCVFAGGMVGLQFYRLLPAHHLTTETRDVVRLGIGMISILATLVLGLLTASAKATYDNTDRELRDYAADLILLDQTLRQLGAAAAPIRKELLGYTDMAVRTTWPDASQKQTQKAPLEDKNAGDLLAHTTQEILALKTTSEEQHWLRGQALAISARLIHTRWTMLINQEGSISPVLLVIMVAWITVIFASFGLNAPRNATVVAAFFVCSLSIGTSIFLILEMDTPFDGVIMISGAPMKNALAHLQAED